MNKYDFNIEFQRRLGFRGGGFDLAEHEEGRRSAASLLLGWLWLAAAGRKGDTSSAKARRGHCFPATVDETRREGRPQIGAHRQSKKGWPEVSATHWRQQGALCEVVPLLHVLARCRDHHDQR